MKTTKAKYIAIIIGLIIFGILMIFGLLNLHKKSKVTFADSMEDKQSENFVVSSSKEVIPATYQYIKLNNDECSVLINNKNEATLAAIKSSVEIDGSTYRVTEIAASGFSSSPNLERVSIPASVKKIGNMAFANCVKLKRADLSNVVEIGNGAFSKCPELSEIQLPKSLDTIGAFVFRSNNTLIKARAESAGADWSPLWNSNNSNQEVLFNNKDVQPLELEPIYNDTSRSTLKEVIGYSLSIAQPRTDNFYSINERNRDEYLNSDTENNIFIPAKYNGIDILEIQTYAFTESNFNQLIIEYSDKKIAIGTEAFSYTDGKNITINRDIDFYDNTYSAESSYIFFSSRIETVVLPSTLNKLVSDMFNGCNYLKNIFFVEPTYIDNQADMLSIIDNLKLNNAEGTVYIPGNSNIKTICYMALSETYSINNLHLDDNITLVENYAINNWDSNKQNIYVHNNKKITTWSDLWNGAYDIEKVKFDKLFFNIYFHTEEGSSISFNEKEVVYNQCIGEMPKTEYEYHIFVSWNSEDGCEYTEDTIYLIKKDLHLFANWKDREYEVTLSSNDGKDEIKTVWAKMNQSMPEATLPHRIGYTFKGYYKDINDTNTRYYNDDMTSSKNWDIDNDATLYAKWEQNSYTVLFNKQYGIGGNDSVVAFFDAPMPEAIQPEKDGSIFDGYYNERNGNGTKYYNADMSSNTNWNIASDTTLFANWEKIPYLVTLYKQDGTDNYEEVTAYFNEYLPNIVVPERIGYKFDGYWTRPNGNGQRYYDEDGFGEGNKLWDKTEGGILYANWKNREYNIELKQEGGSGGHTWISVEYERDMPANIVAPTLKHYNFAGYFDMPKGYGYKYFNPNMSSNRPWDKPEDGVLYAHWEVAKYTISYDIGNSTLPGVNNEQNPNEITYFSEEVTLYAPERIGYVFKCWKLDGEEVKSLKKIDRNIVLVAEWIGTSTNLSRNNSITVSDEISVVYVGPVVVGMEYTINASFAVRQLCVCSDRNCYIKLNIIIDGSRGDFTLILKNIRMTASDYNNAIVMKSNYKLHLYGYNSTVTGGNGLIVDNTAYLNGASAIYCNSLEIHTPIELHGGNGVQKNKAAGGVAVALAGNSSVLTVSSRNVKIVGGNASTDPSGGLYGTKGPAVYSATGKYTLNDNGYNVTIKEGQGSLFTINPIIGY